jgi:hypothetical protein
MKGRDVFINCAFCPDYQVRFQALVFTIVRSGHTPRCARGRRRREVLFEKICRIIRDCAYSVHDISKTDPHASSGLPHINMPFELGLFLGATRFGAGSQKAIALPAIRKPAPEVSELTFKDLAEIARAVDGPRKRSEGGGEGLKAPHPNAARRSIRKARAAGSVWRPIARS